MRITGIKSIAISSTSLEEASLRFESEFNKYLNLGYELTTHEYNESVGINFLVVEQDSIQNTVPNITGNIVQSLTINPIVIKTKLFCYRCVLVKEG